MFAALMRLTVASLTDEAAAMHKSLGEVNLFLEQHACPSMNAWYRPFLSSPLDRDGMDQLLNRVPYF
ncbi:MAG: hypothetical protein IT423_22340 [Pirellulaceae bacterium]|nr:hypothetical protein [Pirellulaceae bacterium]